ncbi:PSP1 C-terminal conserved region-domain-containing protein [Sporodiniella umbellata]|nr:PSP1 C-terminal conserved region-domain-containing protein [Sporodiniella umbellata]
MSQQKSSNNKHSNSEESGLAILKNNNTDNAWKAVGSPSRRGSAIPISPHDSPVTEHPELVRRSSIASEANWGSFGGFQWEGPSIFEEDSGKPAVVTSIPPNAVLPEEGVVPNSILSVPMLPGVSMEPIYRQHRSLSFSMGQDPTFFGYDDYDEPYQHVQPFKSLLEPMAEEEQEEDELVDMMDLAFIRSRSKSSGAAFGLLSHAQHTRLSGRRQEPEGPEEPIQPRRSSRFFHTNELSLGDKEHLQRRRPSGQEYSFPDHLMRRQSLTLNTPAPTNIQQLADQLENTHILNYSGFRPDLFNTFTPEMTPTAIPDSAEKGVQDLGKGIPLSRLMEGPLCMVEFKGKRPDFFYSPHFHPRLGEWVIVEGDRGKDLGKLVANTLTGPQVMALEQKKQARLDSASSTHEEQTKKEVMIKRIFRLAAPDEIHAFMNKEQDELKALAICQQRIKHRKLPMEIVDAEYQWDRRKLTFYFEAQHRIDFRELVRELFKLYKTRIWMCVVTEPVTLDDLSPENKQ